MILPYEPDIVADTTEISHEKWLCLRRTGIGGSDVAAVFGVSPFGTARDLYYDKLNIVSAYDEESNRFQKKIGSLLEDTVAEMFAEMTGYRIFKIRKMYRSKEHPFMLADVDFFVQLPDGSIAILECKTTAPDAVGKWWDGDTQVIPLNYQLQGRHYMSVMHINKIFYACLYGNGPSYFLMREMERDLEYESEMIAVEENFWNGHVLRRVPPVYTEEGELIIESIRRHFGPADESLPTVALNTDVSLYLKRYMELQQEKTDAEVQVKKLDKELQRAKGMIVAEMGAGCSASCTLNGNDYLISYHPVRRSLVNKENLIRLKAQYPQIYDEYVTISESRRFHVKKLKKEAA